MADSRGQSRLLGFVSANCLIAPPLAGVVRRYRLPHLEAAGWTVGEKLAELSRS